MQKVYKRTRKNGIGRDGAGDSLLVFENALPSGNRSDGYLYQEMFVIDPTNEFFIAMRNRLVELIKSKGFADDLTPGDIAWAHEFARLDIAKTKVKEPKHLGAKVINKGILYEAIITDAENTGGMVWFRNGDPVGRDWDAFADDVQVVFEGYKSEES